MPFPRSTLSFIKKEWAVFLGAFLGLFCSHFIQAGTQNQSIHFSGDKQVWDRKANRVELFGHAAVNQMGETLKADYILLDLNSRTLHAQGHCIYILSELAVWGEEMDFNLDTRTGTVFRGRVSNDLFTLRSEKLHKVGPGRFLSHWVEYTTCRDCSASWTFQAEDVDMTVDGYAYFSNVFTRIKDAPAFWLPYLVLPIKTHRQTGFLFPSFSSNTLNGATFLFPFFWAMNRSADMTLGLGEYTLKGHRFEWEGRYALSDQNSAKANAFYLTDRTFYQNRWAFDLTQRQILPFGVEEKLQLGELSDNFYPFHFSNDLKRAKGEPYLMSHLSFSKSDSEVSAFVNFQRNRNLLNSTPSDPQARETQFDPRTVQAFPTVMVTTRDKFFGDTPFLMGMTLGLTNFTRTAGVFDYDASSVSLGQMPPPGLPYRAGIDPLREATRVSLTPNLYTTLRPFDVMSVVPSLQYRQYFYNFSQQVPNLNRGYLLMQVDLSTQIEKIYEFPEDRSISKAKHLIRPLFTYSYIPKATLREESQHPFVQQIKQTGRPTFTPGYNFDNHDIVPYTYQQSSANYFIPLGHSLAYGFSTQWIQRLGDPTLEFPVYRHSLEFNAGQAVNFLELTDPVEPTNSHVFTRLFSNLNLNYDHLISGSTYYYYPDIYPSTSRHSFSTYITYLIERSLRQRILSYERSVTLGYSFSKINSSTSNLRGSFNFSLSDYFLPTGFVSYGFEPKPSRLFEAGLGLSVQSPARCWKMTVGEKYNSATGMTFEFDLALNLTGGGFGGITDLTHQTIATP